MTVTREDLQTERNNALVLLAETAQLMQKLAVEHKHAMLALEEARNDVGSSVYLLETEINAGTAEYSGWTSIHTSRSGAFEAFIDWCQWMEIDADGALHGMSITNTFMGNDSELSDGDTISWGINRMEVKP